MRPDPHPSPAWYLLSLRPTGAHASMRAAAARHGAGLLALSPWRLVATHDALALDAALAAELTLFTSPAAVAHAVALRPDLAGRLQRAGGVGQGTARALRRAGVAAPLTPARMDSEGLLALPDLAAGRRPATVGLVTAPGGRDRIAPALRARGARILRAEVYRREPQRLAPAQCARLAAVVGRSALALSSGEALEQLLPQLPAALAATLRGRPVIAASDRLGVLAGSLGFTAVHRAEGPRPAQLAARAAYVMSPPPR